MGSLARPQKQTQSWQIEPATDADWPGIWRIFHETVQTSDTYAYAPDTTEEDAKHIWIGKGTYGTGAQAFVVRDGAEIVGTFTLRPNHNGLGGHVANAGYMVRADQRGRGIARAMCRFSLEEAARRGFHSMQFNYVVSTNTAAVNLWQAMGFQIIGIAPKSFKHGAFGYVDIYIMHRFLEENRP